VSRIEALSDAVFAFALPLLVVSLEVPGTFDELLEAIVAFPAFAACFAFLIMCWVFHYRFHRRYGLEDATTILLNAILLFVILFYVFPLKFMATMLWASLRAGGAPHTAAGTMIRLDQLPQLFYFYSGGLAVLFGLYAALEWHAYRKRDELELNAVERLMSRSELRSHLISVGFGLLSVGLTLVHLVPFAGLIYFLLGPVQGIHGWRSGRRVERMAADLGGAHGAAP